ncbi:glycosyltransferase family 4 protein [Candidatus Woesearchaeota archaeon]|nr:glycosyltransferase family 4 protein [Candidatus Woesearchaeota archaeon]
MKILVFTSRYTAGRDIISEDFGRQVRIFEQLGKLGHKIDFFCVDYKRLENKSLYLHGMRIFIKPFKPLKFFSLLSELRKTMKSNNYDILIATSDPLWGVIGYFMSKKRGIKFVYDVQDNYRLYESYRIPFFGLFERHAARNADLVICASNALTDDVKGIRKKKTITIPNGVDMGVFKPLDKANSRKMLKLPLDAKIISYMGSIQKLHGVDILIKTFEELRKDVKGARLMLAGKVINANEGFDLRKKYIIYLGSLPQKKVVSAINATDVVVIPYPNNSFTRYMQAPYKLMEFMACNVPLVITDAGEMHKSMKDKKLVAKAGSIDDLKEKIKYALRLKKLNSRDVAAEYDWENIASKLNAVIRDM